MALTDIKGKTHVRYYILLMLFIVTTMNYVDRATLSMAAPAMRKDLGIDTVAIFSGLYSLFFRGQLDSLQV